jgi:hypothetical protein
MIADLAAVLGVCPQALTLPDIETYVGLAHTLFALEDLYGFKIDNIDGELCITLDRHSKSYLSMLDIFSAWQRESAKRESGEITEDEYNAWRYNYPKGEVEQTKAALDKIRAEKNNPSAE